jgi:LysR family transcriptional activator of nhaA
MEWLNYHHFLYFWMVAKEGSIVRAGKQLRLSHPTISGQIRRLEDVLGEKLFVRKGRNLVMTEVGRVAYRYADEIFSLGQEFLDTVHHRAGAKPIRLVVGVSNVLAKSIVYRILAPAFRLEEPVRIVCRDDRSVEAFLGDLAENAVDVILSDAPAPAGTAVRVFNHPLGECGTLFFGAPLIARRLRRRFPRSLDGIPFVLPAADSAHRRDLDEWLRTRDVRPSIVAELDDTALGTVFGEAGLGVFTASDVLEEEVTRRYKVEVLGRAKELRQRFYAISAERKIQHPAVSVICETARKQIFA